MPQIRDIALEELTASGDALPVAGTRVDAAHALGDALAALPPLAHMPVDLAIADLVQVQGSAQVQAQADQLASHLRQRQEELNRREAQLNARLADFEQEVRDARLWLAKRNDELNEREARLAPRDEWFRVQGSAFRTEQAALVVPDEAEPPAGSVGEALRVDRSHGRTPADTMRINPPHDRPSEWEERLQALSRAQEELARRRAALEEFWQESSRSQQRALELRLLAEELVAELRSSLDVARAGEAVRAIRQRLAQRYQNEVLQLTERRDELEWLKSDLAAEDERLKRRCEEMRELIRQQGTGHREQTSNAT